MYSKLYLYCTLFVLATLAAISSNIFSIVYAYDFESTCDIQLQIAPFILGFINFIYVIIATSVIYIVVIYAKSFRLEETIKAAVIVINLIYNLVFLIIGGIMLKDKTCLNESLILIGIPISLMLMFIGYVLVDLEDRKSVV